MASARRCQLLTRCLSTGAANLRRVTRHPYPQGNCPLERSLASARRCQLLTRCLSTGAANLSGSLRNQRAAANTCSSPSFLYRHLDICPHPSRLRRATYTLLCNCHWQLLDLDSLRGAPPQRGRLREQIVTGGSRTSPRPPHNSTRCAVASGVTSPPPPVRHPPVWLYRESGQNTPGTSRPRPG